MGRRDSSLSRRPIRSVRHPTHHLFVENFDAAPYPATLTVVRTDDGLVWRADYEVPDERGFKIPDLLVVGRTYEITIDLEDG